MWQVDDSAMKVSSAATRQADDSAKKVSSAVTKQVVWSAMKVWFRNESCFAGA